MKHIRYRLVCLNLALLMLLTVAPPVRAAETEEDDRLCAAPTEWAGVGSEYLIALSVAEEAIDSENAGNEEDVLAPMLLSAANAVQGYYISINGTAFTSDQTRSGNGWSYDGDGVLELNNYNGGAISASGDLTIYSSGSVSILGSDGISYIGKNAVTVSGNLALYMLGGSFTATGGRGTMQGGWGLNVNGIAYLVSPYNRNNPVKFTAIGGNATSYGGVGICANSIFLDCLDVRLQGGDGNYPQPAIFSTGSCEFGTINASIRSGKDAAGDAPYPIQFALDVTDKTWHYNDRRTSCYRTNSEISIYVKRNKLTLNGSGGRWGNNPAVTLDDYYPSSYALRDYTFSRDGHTQVAWMDASGDMFPLIAYYTPATSTSLRAMWEETEAGDILLNGVWDTFDDGKYWRKTSGQSVTLPETFTYRDAQEALIGWHTDVVIGTDENHVLGKNSVWYAAGDSVQPSSYGPVVLYAEEKSDVAAYALYHTTKGRTATGSDLIVQAASPSDLKAIGGEDYIDAPAGYRFVGWATQEQGVVVYETGTMLPVTMGSALELYAVWQLLGVCHSGKGVNAWVDSAAKTIRLEPQSEWYSKQGKAVHFIGAAYDESGQMMSCTISLKTELEETGFVEMKYTEAVPAAIRLFALDADYQPAGEAAEVGMKE